MDTKLKENVKEGSANIEGLEDNRININANSIFIQTYWNFIGINTKQIKI